MEEKSSRNKKDICSKYSKVAWPKAMYGLYKETPNKNLIIFMLTSKPADGKLKIVESYVEWLVKPHSLEKLSNLTRLLTENPWLPVTSEVVIAVLVSRRMIEPEVLIGKLSDKIEGLNRRL